MESQTINNKAYFDMALREGFGIGYACEVSGNEPKDVCAMFKENPAFLMECEKIVRAANLDLMTAHSDFMKNQQFDKALEVRKQADKIKTVVMWGAGGKITVQGCLKARRNMTDRDCAVYFGMSYAEFEEFMDQNPEIGEMS